MRVNGSMDVLESDTVVQLLDLLRTAAACDVNVHDDVACWVARSASIPEGWSHREVSALLRRDPSEGLYEALLLSGICPTTSQRARGEVVGGACLAYLELIGAIGARAELRRTFEREEAYTPVSVVMLRNLTMLTGLGLVGGGESDGHESSLEPGELTALVVASIGASSFTDRRLAIKAVDGVAGIAFAPGTERGRFHQMWSFGLQKLSDYHPGLDRARLPRFVTD